MESTEKSRFFPNDYNWWEMPEPCGRCKLPMHMASGQDVAFCPNCAADQITAKRGRAMLALMKAKDLRRRLELEDQRRLCPDENAPSGALASGMALCLLLGLLLCLGRPALAECGLYTTCNQPFDFYVPGNLMRLGMNATNAREDDFLRKLGCWSDGDDTGGRIVCEFNGTDYSYEYKRQDDYNPGSILIMVPTDGDIAFR